MQLDVGNEPYLSKQKYKVPCQFADMNFVQECSQVQAQPDGHIYIVIWLTVMTTNIFLRV